MGKYIHKMLKYVAHEMRIIIPVMFYNTMCVTKVTGIIQSSLLTIYLQSHLDIKIRFFEINAMKIQYLYTLVFIYIS